MTSGRTDSLKSVLTSGGSNVRLLVKSQDGPTAWPPVPVDPDEASTWADFVLKSVISLDDEEVVRAAAETVSHLNLDDESRKYLVDSLMMMPLARADVLSSADITLLLSTNQHSDSCLASRRLYLDRHIRKVFSGRCQPWVKHSDRARLFRATFGPLLATAEKVILCDRYAAANLSKKRAAGGFFWLMERIFEAAIPEVEVLTMHDLINTDYAVARPLQVIESLRLNDREAGPRRLTVVSVRQHDLGDEAHDRHLRFLFRDARGSWASHAVSLGKGGDVFGAGKLKDSFSVSLEDPKTAKARETVLRTHRLRVEDTWERLTKP